MLAEALGREGGERHNACRLEGDRTLNELARSHRPNAYVLQVARFDFSWGSMVSVARHRPGSYLPPLPLSSPGHVKQPTTSPFMHE